MPSPTPKPPKMYRWGTDRAARLPKDWAKRRAKTKARANGQCEAQTHDPRCNGVGAECDHITAGDNHSLDNLQWLSSPCHRAKTLREAQQARTRVAASRHRPPDRHPGMINHRA